MAASLQEDQQHADLYKTLYVHLTNIGKSLTCPVCLRTYRDPVLTPCVHAYCHECIETSLRNKQQCPTCLSSCTKRSLVPATSLEHLVDAYKTTLKAMGWTPIHYSPHSLMMTQHDLAEVPDEDECKLHYQVSNTWKKVLDKADFANDALRQQQAAVVAVDEQALVAAKNRNEEEDSKPAAKSIPTSLAAASDVASTHEDTGIFVPKEAGTASVAASASESFQDAKSQVDDEDQKLVQGTKESKVSNQEKMVVEKESATQSESQVQCSESMAFFTAEDEATNGEATTGGHGGPPIRTDPHFTAASVAAADSGADEAAPTEANNVAATAAEGAAEDEAFPTETDASVAATDNDAEDEATETSEQPVAAATASNSTFTKGTIVQVQDRCWPGVNKPGGVARITKIHPDGPYDVAYVLGGREKRVDAGFVSLQQETPKKRQSGMSPALLAALEAEGFDTHPQQQRVVVKKEARSPRRQAPKRKAASTIGPAAKRSKKCKAKSNVEPKELSDEEKLTLANARYEETFEAAEKKSVISVVASSLADSELSMLQRLCKETKKQDVKVKTTEAFHVAKTTLCIMSASRGNEQTGQKRTMKAMRAMLAGIPIVSPAWISSCLDQGKVVLPSPEMYIRTVPAKTSDSLVNDTLGASLYAARLHQQGAVELSNASVLLCGPFQSSDGSPRKNDLQVLLREAKATLLTPTAAIKKLKNANDSSTIVLLCDQCKQDSRCGISNALSDQIELALDRGTPRVLIVNFTWLFDSISCGGTMLSSRPFPPKGPRATKLWNKLQ